MTVHVLRNLVVSVLLPVVELLRSGACSHLVSLPHNVCLDDLETVFPAVDDKPRRNVLSCLVSLHGLEPLVDLIVHVVLEQAHVHVGPVGGEGDGSVKLLVIGGEGVGVSSSSTLSSTQALLLLLDHTSECITKYELEVLIERLIGFPRFIPLIDRKESCNDNFLEGLIEKGKH